MKKIISFLGLYVTIVVFATLNPGFAKAETLECTYAFDNISDQTIKYDWIDKYNKFIELTIDGTTYNINSEYQVHDAYCDRLGTVWASLSNDSNHYYLGFYNFKLQGQDDLNFHVLRVGIVDTYDSERFAVYGSDDKPERYWILPTVEELSNFLSTGQIQLKYVSSPTLPTKAPVTPNPIPEPTSKINVTAAPTTETPVQPNSTPAANPSSVPTCKPIPTASTPVDSNTTPATVGKPASVVKKGSTISLADSSGNIIKTITLKAGKLTVNKKVIKNVKSSYFTKKGTVVYLTKSGKAYYINSKNKPKLIKAKVKQVKTSKGFATNLKLRNGKTVKIRV